MERVSKIERKTSETEIVLELNLDGKGLCSVDCPVGFFGHMLSAFCKHGLFDLSGSLKGDLYVDQHHLIEDTGIVLGQAFNKALGDKAGINRSGCFYFPMDETLVRCAVDFGGRPYLVMEAGLSGIPLSGGICAGENGRNFQSDVFQTDTVEDFWQGFVSGALCNLHIDVIRGRSDHHKIEGIFKAAARAFRDAVEVNPRVLGIPSTKGVI